MITDDLNRFSTAQADVRAAASYLCQKSIPLGSRGNTIGNPPDFFVRVGTAFAGGTSVNFQLVKADDAALSTNLVVLAQSGAIPEASLTKDTIVWKGRLPQNLGDAGFIGIQAVGVGVHTAGDFDAGIAERVPLNVG